jgi:hypothetical protein
MHGPKGGGEAKLKYLSGSFDLIVPGSYVSCAVTGAQIMLQELRYWDWDVQEAYASPEISFKRSEELRNQRK